MAPSLPPQTMEPSPALQSLSSTRYHQVYESSPWHIASNVLGTKAEYKGACPKCSKITNYYNDVCHHCKQEIPMHFKEQVLPSSLTATPVRDAFGDIEKFSRSAQSPVNSSGGARPKTNTVTKPVVQFEERGTNQVRQFQKEEK